MNMRTEGSCFYVYDRNHLKGSFAPYRPYKPSLQGEDDLIVSADLDPL
tara:strand:+ start:106 stop:249 length:144 start_codon:yes stop_codon:yes gene_type:complete